MCVCGKGVEINRVDIHEIIEKRGLPNGMVRYGGGGLENNAAIPATVNEMLLQSYENIIRLFPVWDKAEDASFHGLRAYGAFVIDATLEAGKINAQIFSEKGMTLTLEIPDNQYVLVMGNGDRIACNERFMSVNTQKGETIKLLHIG